MKETGTCPKCLSQDIIRIPGSVRPPGSGDNILAGWTVLSAINGTRYLCAKCGFSEEWVESLDGIQKLKNKFGSTGNS